MGQVILLDDLIVALGGHLLEVKQLRFRVLIEAGNSQIQRGAFHGRFGINLLHI